MKSRIGIALMGLAMLASCANNDDVNNVIEGGQDIITLGATTGNATRAAINDLAGLSASTAGVGVFGQATTASTANTVITTEWSASPLMANVKTTGVDATTGLMSWDNPENYVYPKAAPLNVKFFAYHPYAATGTTGANYVKASAVGVAPSLHFTLTGDEDLMWATPVLGSRTQPASALKFNHQLTQMTFKLVDGEGNFADPITSVSISSNTVGDMNLETGAISNWATPKPMMLNTGNIDMKTQATDKEYTLPKTVMVQPDQASFEISLIAGGNKTATIKPIGDATFKAGKAYLITLRLSGEVPVQMSAEVIPWVTGGTGEGVVE